MMKSVVVVLCAALAVAAALPAGAPAKDDLKGSEAVYVASPYMAAYPAVSAYSAAVPAYTAYSAYGYPAAMGYGYAAAPAYSYLYR